MDSKADKEMLDDKGREREALFATLRNEFSIPLDVIVGYSQILLEELSEENLGYFTSDLKKILVSGNLLQTNLDELLAFSSLTSKKDDFDLKNFSQELQFSFLTLLTSVIGYCDIILEEEPLEQHKSFTDDIRKIHDAAISFIEYINEIDYLTQTQLSGLDLIAQFKYTSEIIRNVLTAIPALETCSLMPHSVYEASILVVDDKSMSRELLLRWLTHYRFNAVGCEDPNKILKSIDLDKYDLILLELVMANVGGFEILKWIKQNKSFAHIPVIVISPLKEIDAYVRCLELGADDYMTKPLNSLIFKTKIAASLERKILRDKEIENLARIENEKARAETLLLNIVPVTIAERLKKGETNIVDAFPTASIVFIDIVGFTQLSESLEPNELISLLNQIFSIFDLLTDKYDLEKIKTIGDSYMAVCGAPVPDSKHAEKIANFALDVLDEIVSLNKELTHNIQVRIGINSGPVLAGVIGKKKFMYDLWGRTVNTASRLESHGMPGCIQISVSTYQLVKDLFVCQKRGPISIKGLGLLDTYILLKRSV